MFFHTAVLVLVAILAGAGGGHGVVTRRQRGTAAPVPELLPITTDGPQITTNGLHKLEFDFSKEVARRTSGKQNGMYSTHGTYDCIGRHLGLPCCDSKGCLKVKVSRKSNKSDDTFSYYKKGWMCGGCIELSGAKNPYREIAPVDYEPPIDLSTQAPIKVQTTHGEAVPIAGGSKELIRELDRKDWLVHFNLNNYTNTNLPEKDALNEIIEKEWNVKPLMQQYSYGKGRGSGHVTSGLYITDGFFLDTWTGTQEMLRSVFGGLFDFLELIESNIGAPRDTSRGHFMMYTATSLKKDEEADEDEIGQDEENNIGVDDEEDEEDDEEGDEEDDEEGDEEWDDMEDILEEKYKVFKKFAKFGICKEHPDKPWERKPLKRCLGTIGDSMTAQAGRPKIFRLMDRKYGRWVDIVCNHGTFLMFAQEVMGIDVDSRFTHSVRWAAGTYCLVIDIGQLSGDN